MNRYVDAAAVRAAIVNAREAALEHKPYGWEWENNGYNGAILAAGRVPAADVRPVIRGKWKKHYADHEAFGERPFCRYCSVCNAITVFPYNFCPNCGADMRQEEVDEDA